METVGGWASYVLPVLLGGGVMAFLTAVFSSIWTRKNLNADTVQKLTDASGEFVDRVSLANNIMWTREDRHERVIRVYRAVTWLLLEETEKRDGFESPSIKSLKQRILAAEAYTAAERRVLPESGNSLE